MKILLSLLAAFILSLSPVSATRSHDYAHSAMHQVAIVNSGKCTAYATGPHTIMIAEHCLGEQPANDIFVLDPDSKYTQTAIVSSEIFDHADHVIVELKGVKFSEYVDVNARTFPQQGDHVHFWGSPAAVYCRDCYHEGYYSGLAETDDSYLLLFVMAGAPGDSGSLIFDQNNSIVGMVSLAGEGFIASFPLKFSDAEWEQAKK